jgi:hypothetical protein
VSGRRMTQASQERDERLAREEKADDQFIAYVISWEKWIEVAEELLTASNILGERVIAQYGRWLEVTSEPQEDPEVFARLWTHEDEKLFGVHNLLLAYTMENFLKALYVKRKNAMLREQLAAQYEKRHARRMRGDPCGEEMAMRLAYIPFGLHDLNKIADAAEFRPLADYDRWLFTKFSRWAVWAGRYPVPKGSKDMSERKNTLSSQDPEDTAEMIGRIREAIEECPNPDEDSR